MSKCSHHERDHHRQVTTNWMVVTWCFIISYLIVSSSAEFAPYAPIQVGPVSLYVVTSLAGLLTGYFVEDLVEGISKVALFVVIPSFVGGAARTILPVLIIGGDSQMMVLVGSWVLQRVLVQILVLALFGVASYLLSVVAYESFR